MTITRNTAAIGAAAATLALLILANFVAMDPGEAGGTMEFIVTGTLALGAWLLLFGWYAPRADRPAAAGVAAGVFALVSVVAFWSGLPIVLGAAAVVLGARGRESSPRAGLVAIVVGASAIAIAAALTVYEVVS
jgi:hypothetical protein